MYESATEDANSTQAAETTALDQQIASKKAELAEHERLARSAGLRLRAYSDGSLFAFEQRQRRQELWAKIVEQPHHKYLDSGELPEVSGAIVDLVLDPAHDSKTKFICFQPPENEGPENKGEAPQISYSEILAANDHAYLPPQVDSNLLHSIRMPIEAAPYESLPQLISAISTLILRCVAVSDSDARLLAHFVLSTWLIDRLPVAPYLALVGPPQSGKTTLLRVLHLLCRRSLSAADATASTLLHLCHKLHPTLLIDETSTNEGPAALRRLLRVGNTPGSLVLRHKQAWNVFGPKVICWRQLPDDAALNSRCIILPMHNVNNPALRLPDDPEIVSAAAALQSQLLYYRLANYRNVGIHHGNHSLASRDNVGIHRGSPGFQPGVSEADFAERKEASTLPSRQRELYLALATPCINDEDSSRFLLDYFRRAHSEDALSSAEHAVLAALFQSAHMPELHGQLLLKDIAIRANQCLQNEGESLRLSVRQVGSITSSLGFGRRHRTMNGWKLLLEKSDQQPLHDSAARYGVDQFPQNATGLTRCPLCPNIQPPGRASSVGVLVG